MTPLRSLNAIVQLHKVLLEAVSEEPCRERPCSEHEIVALDSLWGPVVVEYVLKVNGDKAARFAEFWVRNSVIEAELNAKGLALLM